MYRWSLLNTENHCGKHANDQIPINQLLCRCNAPWSYHSVLKQLNMVEISNPDHDSSKD